MTCRVGISESEISPLWEATEYTFQRNHCYTGHALRVFRDKAYKAGLFLLRRTSCGTPALLPDRQRRKRSLGSKSQFLDRCQQPMSLQLALLHAPQSVFRSFAVTGLGPSNRERAPVVARVFKETHCLYKIKPVDARRGIGAHYIAQWMFVLVCHISAQPR